MDDFTGSDLSPSVALIQMLTVAVFLEVELVGYLFIKGLLFLLQGLDLITLAFNNLFSDRFLSAHRIDADYCSLDIQQGQ